MSEETGTSWFVVKAQIHAGGRGKGGGVKLTVIIVEEVVDIILGMDLSLKPLQRATCIKFYHVEDVYYPGASEPDIFTGHIN